MIPSFYENLLPRHVVESDRSEAYKMVCHALQEEWSRNKNLIGQLPDVHSPLLENNRFLSAIASSLGFSDLTDFDPSDHPAVLSEIVKIRQGKGTAKSLEQMALLMRFNIEVVDLWSTYEIMDSNNLENPLNDLMLNELCEDATSGNFEVSGNFPSGSSEISVRTDFFNTPIDASNHKFYDPDGVEYGISSAESGIHSDGYPVMTVTLTSPTNTGLSAGEIVKINSIATNSTEPTYVDEFGAVKYSPYSDQIRSKAGQYPTGAGASNGDTTIDLPKPFPPHGSLMKHKGHLYQLSASSYSSTLASYSIVEPSFSRVPSTFAKPLQNGVDTNSYIVAFPPHVIYPSSVFDMKLASRKGETFETTKTSLQDKMRTLTHFIPLRSKLRTIYDMEATTESESLNFPFDFAIVRYVWDEDAGNDLDTRTSVINPDLEGSVGYARKRYIPGDTTVLGGCRLNTVTYDEETMYLYHGGDNCNTGVEAVLINFKQLAEDYPNISSLKIDLKAFFYSSIGTGNINLVFETYEGGSMDPDGSYDFTNTGGTLKQSVMVDRTVLTQRSSGSEEGDPMGSVIYNTETRTANITD